MDPFRGSCHLFISSEQQLPATNSSCHPAKGHLSIFMKSNENFKAKQMTKYLTVFICLFGYFYPCAMHTPSRPPWQHLTFYPSLALQPRHKSCHLHLTDGEAETLNLKKCEQSRARQSCITGGLQPLQVPRERQWPSGKRESILIQWMPTWSRTKW